MNKKIEPTANPLALIPLAVFLISYVVASILIGDFYKIPIAVAFIFSSITAIAISKGDRLNDKIELFCKGAANSNIMMMVLIFILAGAFCETAKQAGAVDATVNLAMWLLPQELLAAGIFIAACFISLSIGTSVGTIVALTPVAIGIAERTGTEAALMLAVVVSGAMFGDNLSFISDTTIIATKSQHCKMSDKFKMNIRIALPIAIITAILYIILGARTIETANLQSIEWIKVIPYMVVLISAISGMNVLVVITLGIALSGSLGLLTGSFDLLSWFDAMGRGINNMGELIIITILAGGMLEIIRYNGGFSWIIKKLTSNIHSTRGGELSIAGLVSLANLCTANNTIALIMSGSIAKDIASKYKIDPRRSASILDMTSCFVQGIIPYGAQLLMASGLGNASPIDIMQYLYYPYLLGFGTLLAILFRYPSKYC